MENVVGRALVGIRKVLVCQEMIPRQWEKR